MAFSTEKDLGNMVQMWQEEQQIFDYNSNQCNPHPSDPLLRACGHYTQVNDIVTVTINDIHYCK